MGDWDDDDDDDEWYYADRVEDDSPVCEAVAPPGFICTRPLGHEGRHGACDDAGRLVHVWEGG